MLIGSSQVSLLIRDLFESSYLNFLQGIDYKFKKVNTVDDCSETLTAQIGASSSDLNIQLLLRVPKLLLSLLLPSGQSASVQKDTVLADWVLELSNQLLGKLKSDLVSHECRLDLGIPILYTSPVPTSSNSADAASQKWLYEIENSVIECCLSINVINDGLTIRRAKVESDSVEEGELELF